MPRKIPRGVPQIVTIVSLTTKKQISLKKAARQHLGLDGGQVLWLSEDEEILVSASANANAASYELKPTKGNRITLPDPILARLGLKPRDRVGGAAPPCIGGEKARDHRARGHTSPAL